MDETQEKSVGEAFLGRQLEKETRAGVLHYVVGQHHAELQGPPEEVVGAITAVAQLSYAAPLGVVILVVISVDRRPWELALPEARVLGTLMDYGMRPLPVNFEINLEMRAALRDIAPPSYLPDYEVPEWVAKIAESG